MQVKYHGPSAAIVVEGIEIERGGVGEVPDEVGDSLIESGDFSAVAADKPKTRKTATEGDAQ